MQATNDLGNSPPRSQKSNLTWRQAWQQGRRPKPKRAKWQCRKRSSSWIVIDRCLGFAKQTIFVYARHKLTIGCRNLWSNTYVPSILVRKWLWHTYSFLFSTSSVQPRLQQRSSKDLAICKFSISLGIRIPPPWIPSANYEWRAERAKFINTTVR